MVSYGRIFLAPLLVTVMNTRNPPRDLVSGHNCFLKVLRRSVTSRVTTIHFALPSAPKAGMILVVHISDPLILVALFTFSVFGHSSLKRPYLLALTFCLFYVGEP